MNKLGHHGARCYFHNSKTRRKPLNGLAPVNTKFFYAPLQRDRPWKFVEDHAQHKHVAAMYLNKFHSKSPKEAYLIAQVFEQERDARKFCKIPMVYPIPSLIQEHLGAPSLAAIGNGFQQHETGIYPRRSRHHLISVGCGGAEGCLFKDEKTKAWIKDAPSDSESEANSTSESHHDRKEPMIFF